jgi:tRNA threonylcarbamoyladenosine biosynthesis protein TsaE
LSTKNFTITDLLQLKDVAVYLKSLLSKHTIFLFDGEMGAGKTTLINEICKLLKIEEQPSSPTYSIVNTYSSKQLGEFYHFDFYRLKGEQEAVESGLDELIYSGNICFIEWGEKVAKLLPNNFVRVTIKVISSNHRTIEIIEI